MLAEYLTLAVEWIIGIAVFLGLFLLHFAIFAAVAFLIGWLFSFNIWPYWTAPLVTAALNVFAIAARFWWGQSDDKPS